MESQTSRVEAASMSKLIIPELVASGYRRSSCEIEYSPSLTRWNDGMVIVNIDRNKARELAVSLGGRLSTATEEQVLSELGYESPAFHDTFARNDQKKYFWNWTDTGLVKPEVRNKKKSGSDETKTKGNTTYWKRIVTEGREPVGELWIPEGGGKVIKEWSLYGLPSETADEHPNQNETHFYFDNNLDEIAVLRGRRWYAAHADCFCLDAGFRPSDSLSYGGFRLVRSARLSYAKISQEQTPPSEGRRMQPQVLNPEESSKAYRRGYKDGEKIGYEKARDEIRRFLTE